MAKASPYDTVRTAAVGRISDVRALGSVARHAADGQTALEAVGRIADVSELVNVALKTEHKDAGVAALERAAETTTAGTPVRDLLENAAAKAKSKAVVKRARGMIQALDEAAAAQRAALEAWQQRTAGVMARLEALAAAPGPDSRARARRRRIGMAEPGRHDGLRDGSGCDGALWRARRRRRVPRSIAAIVRTPSAGPKRNGRPRFGPYRLSLCDRVEALRGDEVADDIAKARAEWEGLPGPGEQEIEDAELRARFEEACRRAIERQQNQEEIQKSKARLADLATEAERLAAEAELPEHSWNAVVAEWRTILPKADDIAADVTERFERAETAVKAREDERRAAAERLLRQQLQRIDQLIDRAQKRAAAEDLTLREADRAARDLRAALDAPPQLSFAVQGFDEREQHALVERLRAAIAALAPRLHELREMDEWKRFANAAVQEELIAKTESLRVRYGFDSADGPKPEDVEKAARELHDIQERWKQVAEAPRAQAQALWHRYRLAADPIQAKAREFFAHRAEERTGNLQRKVALIERAEALADSTDWIKTADELKKLQAEWQLIGPVPRQDTKATWKRFRDACDRFFSRRNSDLAERKEAWAANLAKKEALCARAEELAVSREWEKAAGEIRRLQAEWKTVGPVRRNKSEAIWARFRGACDTFFERYKRRDEIELEAKQADREALVNEIASLAPAAPAREAPQNDAPQDEAPEPVAPPSDLLDRVRSLRTRWNQTTPVVRHGADPLSSQFVNALERVITSYPDSFRGTELDSEANRQRMEKLCTRVEALVADQPATPAGSSKALAEMLREALASNTIGGRASEESKWRAMAEEVRQAQSSWTRLGPVPGDAGRELTERFHRACNRFFDQYRRRVPQQAQSRGNKPVGAR